MDNRPIGVFDSGVGGLTVVKEIIGRLPNESILYFGDCARAPYGELSADVLTKYAMQITSFLLQNDVKALVVACNTMTATCMDVLTASCPVPVIGVIEPGVIAAAEVCRRSVCLLATKATVLSGAHKRLLESLLPGVRFDAVVCSRFVPLVESGAAQSLEAFECAKIYLSNCDKNNTDTLILGCTHYPFLMSIIRRAVGSHVTIVDPARKTAEMLENTLITADICASLSQTPCHNVYVSGGLDKCNFILNSLIGMDIYAKLKVL